MFCLIQSSFNLFVFWYSRSIPCTYHAHWLNLLPLQKYEVVWKKTRVVADGWVITFSNFCSKFPKICIVWWENATRNMHVTCAMWCGILYLVSLILNTEEVGDFTCTKLSQRIYLIKHQTLYILSVKITYSEKWIYANLLLIVSQRNIVSIICSIYYWDLLSFIRSKISSSIKLFCLETKIPSRFLFHLKKSSLAWQDLQILTSTSLDALLVYSQRLFIALWPK